MVWHFKRRRPRREEPPSPPSPPPTPSVQDPVSQLHAEYADIAVSILERARKKALKHQSGDVIVVEMTKAERARCAFPVLLEELVFNRTEEYGISPEEAYHQTFTFTVI